MIRHVTCGSQSQQLLNSQRFRVSARAGQLQPTAWQESCSQSAGTCTERGRGTGREVTVMRWGHDKLVDQLIANNAARPRPGMDKPDKAMLAITSSVPLKVLHPKQQVAQALLDRRESA